MTIQEYNDIYKNSITKSMQIESSGGVTITNTNICSEQISLEEALCSEENLIIGSCESACFKIRIADMNHNFEGETLTVYQMIMVDAGGDLLLESGDSDYILLENGNRISLEMVGVPVPYGKFKVLSDKPTNDRRWRDLTCYDAMYDILNADVAEWYNSLTFPMTIKNFRYRFFNYLGITQDTVTLVNDNFETQGGFSVSGSLSGKDVITSICELNGVFGHISRDGLFEYISLPSADTIALDWYIDGTGAYEDYLVQKITGIVARSSEDDVGTTVGTDTNLYVVEGNPLIYGSEGTASLTTALTNLLNNVKDINYRPFNVDTYGNPMLPLGTNLTITTRNQTINSFLMTRVLSGIQSLKDSISAKGEKYRPTEVNSLRSETKRTKGIIHELINDVDELRSTITDLDNQTSSEIQQLSDEIVLKVDASGNIVKVALASNASEGSTFAVNADNIRFTAGSVMRFDANNIVINSTYFKVDQYGNLESTSGKIGGWYIRSGGLSNGMTTATDFANTGIFLSSGGRIVINDANTHTNSMIDKGLYAIIRNDIGANAYVGYISNSTGFGFVDAYGNQVSFRGTALNLGCVKDGTSVISNVKLEMDAVHITMWGGDTGYANKTISLFGGFRDNSWTNEKVTYVDTYKGLQTCDTTKTEVEYVHGVTSNIQTQLDGKQATITGGATTIVADNLTASKALVSNANGKVAVSNVTDTELGYLSGATSNIQGQIDDVNEDIDTTLVEVTGNPITITDAANIPCEELEVTIEPQQDLHGYDYPWAGGTGKNKLPLTVDGIKNANSGATWNGNTAVIDGITYTILTDSDGNVTGINADGTASAISYLVLCNAFDSTSLASCIANGLPGNSGVLCRISSQNNFVSLQEIYNNSTISDNGNNLRFSIRIASGTQVSNIKFYPMIRLASEPDTTFSSYENICPISGLTEVKIDRCGKNLIDPSKIKRTTMGTDSPSNAWVWWNQYIRCNKDDIFFVNCNVNLNQIYLTRVYEYDEALNRLGIQDFNYKNPNNVKFTIQNEKTKYFLFGFYNGTTSLADYDFSGAQLEIGETSTAYEPYQGTQITIQFGQTVYGGTVNYNTGVVTVTEKNVEYDGSSDENWWISGYGVNNQYGLDVPDIKTHTASWAKLNGLICDKWKPITFDAGYGYTDFGISGAGAPQIRLSIPKSIVDRDVNAFKTYLSNNPIQVVYPLATPITIQLSPQELELLKGDNTLTSNGASIRLVYQKDNAIGDIKKWVDERLDYYSLEEQETNEVWIDGKRIYKKTFNLTLTEGPSTSHSFEKNVDVTDLNIDMMISIDGVWRRIVSSGWNAYYQLGGNESGYGDSCGRLSSDKKTITLLFKTEGTNSQIFTIKYTKAS